MAIAVDHKRVSGQTITTATLLDGVGAVAEGEYINTEGLATFTIDVSGITTATVNIWGSNDAAHPTDSGEERELDSIIADELLSFTGPISWVKARCSAWTAGTITAILKGSSRT